MLNILSLFPSDMSRRSFRLISSGYYNSDEESDSSSVTNICYRENPVKYVVLCVVYHQSAPSNFTPECWLLSFLLFIVEGFQEEGQGYKRSQNPAHIQEQWRL